MYYDQRYITTYRSVAT